MRSYWLSSVYHLTVYGNVVKLKRNNTWWFATRGKSLKKSRTLLPKVHKKSKNSMGILKVYKNLYICQKSKKSREIPWISKKFIKIL